jgi:hypothetical protein
MHDICVREINLSDEQRIQRQESRDRMRFNWESLPTIGFAGLVVSVSLFIIAKCFWEADIGIVLTMTVGGVAGMALGYLNERRRVALIPESEKRWHSAYIALCDEIEGFSERLEAFRQLAMTFERGQEFDRTLIGKYKTERDTLADRMRVFRRTLALKRFENAVAKNTDGRFRDTRDVTEQVFVHRVRVAQEEAEISALLTKDESPNEAQFRKLEEEYGDDVPASKSVRRIS